MAQAPLWARSRLLGSRELSIPAAARRRSFAHPIVPMLVATVVGVLFALLRLHGLHDDPSRFVVAGDHHVRVAGAPRSLHVLRDSAGYDGQYFYRLALDPFPSARTAHGISLDHPAYRQQRILYPLLAWLASGGGNARAAQWALIGVNVGALALLGLLAGLLAQAAGRSALWGVGLVAYPGFALTMARDLAEVVAACGLVGGLWAARRSRPLAGGLCLAAAVLAKETTIVFAVALALGWLWRRTGHWVTFVLPLAAAAIVQLVLLAVWGRLPVLDGGANLGALGVGIARYAPTAFDVHSGLDALQLIELLFVGAVAVAVALSLRASRAPAHEKVAWVLALALSLSLTRLVWVQDWAFLRATTELYVLGFAILLSRRGWWPAVSPTLAAGGLWLATASMRLHSP